MIVPSMKNIIMVASLGLMLVGCSSAKVTSINVSPSTITHKVNSIAIAPNGGLIGEAVSIQLSNLGFEVVDPGSLKSVLARANLSEYEVSSSVGLEVLKEKGIDAYLVVKGARSYDNQLESVSARVTSTHTGQIISGVSWQNGYGGVPGSPADRVMRQGLAEAAQTIATEIAKSLRR